MKLEKIERKRKITMKKGRKGTKHERPFKKGKSTHTHKNRETKTEPKKHQGKVKRQHSSHTQRTEMRRGNDVLRLHLTCAQWTGNPA